MILSDVPSAPGGGTTANQEGLAPDQNEKGRPAASHCFAEVELGRAGDRRRSMALAIT